LSRHQVVPFNRKGGQFDVGRDGRFLVNMLLDNVGASPITLLQNWKHGN
jgi:hypothetical protein